jgi:hypothetical protein
MQQCFKQEPILKRFVPTNEEKLVDFFTHLQRFGVANAGQKFAGMTAQDLQSFIGMVKNNKKPPHDINVLLTSKYGEAAKEAGVKLPFLFGDNELSIDMVKGERIEVEGPESEA